MSPSGKSICILINYIINLSFLFTFAMFAHAHVPARIFIHILILVDPVINAIVHRVAPSILRSCSLACLLFWHS